MDKSRLPIKNREEYYMGIAISVRRKANCKGSRVGAVLVKDIDDKTGKGRIISTGYNGTPSGYKNCLDGGCPRCNHREKFRGMHDFCICVHAEQNALMTSARFGISTEGAIMYSTLRPCFNCFKLMIQAGIKKVYYLHELGGSRDSRIEEMEEKIPNISKQIKTMDEKIREKLPISKVEMEDEDHEWSLGTE